MLILKRNDLYKTLNTNSYTMVCESVIDKTSQPLDKFFDIFLCHSTNDAKEVRALKSYFLEQGKEAYVAEIDDPELDASKVNKETAKILQNRMMHSKELYYVLSKNSQSSTWMPWELGFFDGKKSSSNINILSIIDEKEMEILEFKGHEYLELYTKDNSFIPMLQILKELKGKKMYVF